MLNSGKQIKLFGNSIAIGKSLEIGERYTPSLFAASNEAINNPHQFTVEELMEVSDYSIQLWMERNIFGNALKIIRPASFSKLAGR